VEGLAAFPGDTTCHTSPHLYIGKLDSRCTHPTLSLNQSHILSCQSLNGLWAWLAVLSARLSLSGPRTRPRGAF
jgi:hypothetical protein